MPRWAILQDWWTAIRGLPENPLSRYSGKLSKSRQGLRYWAVPVEVALGIVVAFGMALHYSIWKPSLLLPLLVLVPAVCRLLRQLFVGAYACSGLLQRENSGRAGGLDELVLTCGLTDQELVLAIWWRQLRRVLLPLLAMAVAATVIMGVVFSQSAIESAKMWSAYPSEHTHSPIWLARALRHYWLLSPLTAGLVALHGLLASCILFFALIALSCARRAGQLPFFAAGFLLLIQALLLGYTLYCSGLMLDFLWPSYEYPRSVVDTELRSSFPAMAALLTCVVMMLARRWGWLRVALVTSLPALLLVALIIVLPRVGGHFSYWGFMEEEVLECYWPLTAICVLDPVVLGLDYWQTEAQSWPGEYYFEFADSTLGLSERWRTPLMFGLQLCLLLVCAEFARDAFKRRKWATNQDVYRIEAGVSRETVLSSSVLCSKKPYMVPGQPSGYPSRCQSRSAFYGFPFR